MSNRPFNFWKLAWQGWVIGCLLALAAMVLSCNPPRPNKKKEKADSLHVAHLDDSLRLVHQLRNFRHLKDSMDSVRTHTIPVGYFREPKSVEGYVGDAMQQIQQQRLANIEKMVGKLVAGEKVRKDTAYRKNLFAIQDTIYYAIVERKRGRTAIYINQQYTDQNYFIFSKTIDTLLP